MPAKSATCLCMCWRLTRRDSLQIGFTDHDKNLKIHDVTYHARSGLTPADIDSKSGFAIDNSSVSGLLSHELITPEDISAGVYGGAKVEIFKMDWSDFGRAPIPVWTGYFGVIEQAGSAFTAELIGQASQLSRTQGRVFSKVCSAQFGDAQCGLVADDFASGTTCPRTFSACRDQFANTVNYRGFPYLIGDDAMQSGPGGANALDGGSRYGKNL